MKEFMERYYILEKIINEYGEGSKEWVEAAKSDPEPAMELLQDRSFNKEEYPINDDPITSFVESLNSTK